MLDFDELRLRVRRIGPERFLAVANGPVQAASILAIGDQPRALRTALDRLADGGASRDDAQARLREIGRDVSATLFGTDGGSGTDGLGACLAGALQHARSTGVGPQLGALAGAQSRGLRVRLDLPAELQDLPVEALIMPPAMSGTSAEQVIALNSDQSVVRSRVGGLLRSQLPEAADSPDRIHLLVAVATPDGLPDSSPEDELTALKESLYGFTIKIDVLRHATQARIDEWLDTHLDVPTAVVLVAHARHDESGEGTVYLESEDGTARQVPGRVLAGILGRAHRLRLVILSLCGDDTAAASPPVADLARALLEQGIPAAIGMPVRAGGDGGAAFWTHVISGICANRTLDEAVMTARARTHTASGAGAVEWAMPMVFLHEDCGQAWLFKAREVGDDDSAVSDPLRQGAEAHHKVDASQGRIPVADLLAAARYARSRRDWGGVVSLVGPKRPRRTQEEEAMAVEARLELAWPQVEQLCGHLAAGRAGDADAILGKLGSPAVQLPKRLLVLLRAEVADAVCYARGRAAEAAAQWTDAAQAYQECPDYRDAAARSRYAQGEVAAAGEDWTAARTFFETLPAGDWDVWSLLERTRAGLHAMAQRAGAAGDWTAAAGYYGQLPPEEEDVAGLVGYAQARGAEAASQWSGARQRYVALPSGLLDVQDRLRYVTGCMHAVAGEWDLVVEGFGVLPDSYADGRVGPLRRVARARIAGGRGDWREALAHLGSIADTALGGQVGVVRHLAYGKLREQDGDWPASAAAYARVADADQEAANAREYALARACETDGDWGGALRCYAALPGGYRDVVKRRPYTAARLAEDDDTPDWPAVLAAYLAVPDGFGDAQARTWYARLRVALARGQWEPAIEAADWLDGLCDSAGLADYARGRLAGERGDWAAAIACLERAATVGYADTAGLLAYAQGRQCESVGGLQAAIEAYEAAGPVEDAEARRTWLADLLRLWPWAGEGPLVPDPLADRDPSFPYTALRSARITPASSAEAVNDVIYTLMEQGGMGWRERVAWDELRIPASRLLTDALLHRMRDPERLAAVLSGGGSGGGQAQEGAEQGQPEPTALPTTRELLSARMGDDGPLLMLLTGDRDGALRGWRDRLAAAPADLIAVHCLAVAGYWHARDLEETGAWEQAELAWREALACWAVLLTNSGYWTSWRQSRAARFGHAVLPADTARLRVELAEFLARELSRYADRHGDAGRPEQGRRYRELIYLLEANLDGAGALEEAGGLLVPAPDGSVPILAPTVAGTAGPDTVPPAEPQAVPQAEAGAEPDVKLVCGAGYLPLGRLDLPIAGLVLQLERQAQADDPDASGEQLRRLRSAFSELSAAFSHAEHHRFEPALRSLEAQTALGSAHPPRLSELPPDCPDSATHLAPRTDPEACAECRDFLERNPAYALLPRRRARLLQDTVLLAVRAHLCIARDLLPVRPEGAMAAMRAAIEVSESAAMAVRTKEAVLRMILGRVEALTRGGKPRLARLEEALALVTSALPVLGQFKRSMLTAKQAEILADRGIWYRLDCRDEGIAPNLERSLADLREAMRINPDSATARAHLARGLIFGTKGLPASAPRDILAGLRLLSQGLVQTPRNHILGEAWRLALGELEPLLLSGLTMEQLARSAGEYSDDDSASLDPLQRAQYLFAQARRYRSGGDLPGALLTLIRASRSYQSDEQIRHSLLDALAEYFDLPIDPSTSDHNPSARGDNPSARGDNPPEGRHA